MNYTEQGDKIVLGPAVTGAQDVVAQPARRGARRCACGCAGTDRTGWAVATGDETAGVQIELTLD